MRSLFLLLLLSLISCSRPGVLLVATDTNRPPMVFVDDEKHLAGFEIDLVRALAASQGVRVEFVQVHENGFFRAVPGFGILSGLDRNDYDAVVSSTPISNTLRGDYGVTTAYLNAGPVLVVPRGSGRLEDWNAGSLAVLPGDPQTAVALVPSARDASRPYYSLEGALDDLTEHRVAGLVAPGPEVAAALAENERFRAFLSVADGPFGDDATFGIIVRKGNRELLDRLNRGLRTLADNGALAALREKWLLR